MSNLGKITKHIRKNIKVVPIEDEEEGYFDKDIKEIDKYIEESGKYVDDYIIHNKDSLDSLQKYKDLIIIGEWEILDVSVERYVSIEFIFGNKYNDGEPATDEQIFDYIDDFGFYYDHRITYNSHSKIYRDPFGRASVNAIYEKYIKLLEN